MVEIEPYPVKLYVDHPKWLDTPTMSNAPHCVQLRWLFSKVKRLIIALLIDDRYAGKFGVIRNGWGIYEFCFDTVASAILFKLEYGCEDQVASHDQV